MSTALVPVYRGRPAFIERPGGLVVAGLSDSASLARHGAVVVCLSVHDAYHLQTKAAYRARLRTAARLKRGIASVVEAYGRWFARDVAWYDANGIEPPGWQGRPRLVSGAREKPARPVARKVVRVLVRPLAETCPNGHAYAGATRADGWQQCRVCLQARRAIYRRSAAAKLARARWRARRRERSAA